MKFFVTYSGKTVIRERETEAELRSFLDSKGLQGAIIAPWTPNREDPRNHYCQYENCNEWGGFCNSKKDKKWYCKNHFNQA